MDAVYVNSDQTRKGMDAWGKYRFEDKLSVYEEMAKAAGDALRRGSTVVVDATFYRSEMRDIFLTLATLLHQPLCTIEIQAEENIIRQRLSKARPDSEADFAVYRQLKADYEKPSGNHLVLQSTDTNIDSMLTKASTYIQRLHAGTRG